MRKLVAVLLLIGFGVVLFYYTDYKMSENRVEKSTTEFDAILAYPLDDQYPDTPKRVIAFNNRILAYMYGNEEFMINDQIRPLLLQQRKLFDDELLNINPIDVQVEKARTEINGYKTAGVKIIDSASMDPEPVYIDDEEQENLTKIKVLFYTNAANDLYFEYGLRKTNMKWKILGWSQISEFTPTEDLR